jgi:hypothetical protein
MTRLIDNETDDAFSSEARRLLDESTEHMDAATLSRLHQVRNRALATPRSRSVPWYGWASGGAVAASVLVALILFDTPQPSPVFYDDQSQQAAAENIELLEDMEFMAWMLLQEESDAPSRS